MTPQPDAGLYQKYAFGALGSGLALCVNTFARYISTFHVFRVRYCGLLIGNRKFLPCSKTQDLTPSLLDSVAPDPSSWILVRGTRSGRAEKNRGHNRDQADPNCSSRLESDAAGKVCALMFEHASAHTDVKIGLLKGLQHELAE